MSLLIVRSHDLDPYRNLAIEDSLLDRIEEFGRVLFLWQSDHTVVIGKNQNPWRECRLDLLREDRGLLARRVSGGGAVFHDQGNLNFAFVLKREEYDPARQFDLVTAALEAVGVNVERLNRNSLGLAGKKVSGNAFCLHRNAALHHGTLLVSTNLDRLRKYLGPSPLTLSTRAVPSEPAEVANLRDSAPGLDVEHVAESLVHTVAAAYGETSLVHGTEVLESPALHALRHQYVSWEWCYGRSPPFEVELDTTFSWGAVKLRFAVARGMITRAAVETDAMDGAEIGHLEGELLDCPFKENALARRIRKGIGRDGNAFLEDLAEWIRGQALS